MTTNKQTIYYTLTDEAPSLATCSLLPIVRTFTTAAGIEVKISDISLASRILSAFPDNLTDDQKVPDGLAFLGKLTQDPNANIVKLPNISASIPQLKACIAELQAKGYDIPDYPEAPQAESETDIQLRYGKIQGSAVTRCCVKVTLTVAHLLRLKHMYVNFRIQWVSGAKLPALMLTGCAAVISSPVNNPSPWKMPVMYALNS